jgi:hypothetical protein
MKRLLLAGAVLLAAAATTAFVVRGGLATSSAKAASTGNRLSAYVVASNQGPIPPCDTNCTAANYDWNFIHVVNANQLGNVAGFTDRTTWPNSFVIDSVDQTVFVNGVQFGDTGTFTPPPNANLLGWSGRWPSTVDCEGQPGSFHTPCDVVLNPAVLPGENTTALYAGWIHGVGEPTGTYTFRYTVHGTLNGAPVDVTASTLPIRMT